MENGDNIFVSEVQICMSMETLVHVKYKMDLKMLDEC